MAELTSSPFFGIALTALCYVLGVKIQKKTGLVICNSLVLAALIAAMQWALSRPKKNKEESK